MKHAIILLFVMSMLTVYGFRISACAAGPGKPAECETKEEQGMGPMTKDSKDFFSTEIDDAVWTRIYGKSFKKDCTVPREELRYLHLLHKDIEGVTHEGEMICSRIIAEDLLEIFKGLYEGGYPIEKIKLIDEYDADDESSMADNNSSCFNYRTISFSRKLSNHALGLAVDINPLYNPYVKTVNGQENVEPANGKPYTDRNSDFPYKLTEGDLCYRLFTEHGFSWGGHWKNSKDYQHFEYTGNR